MERSVEFVADGTVRLPLWRPCAEDNFYRANLLMLKLTSAESAMPDEMPARIDEVTTTLKQIGASFGLLMAHTP
jgi:hypothetical protein